jgi:hypothetical protein
MMFILFILCFLAFWQLIAKLYQYYPYFKLLIKKLLNIFNILKTFLHTPIDITKFLEFLGKLKKFIKTVILFFIGLAICSFFFYLRIILERIPHEIDFSWDIYQFFFSLALFLLFTYLIKKKIYPKESKNKIIKWIKENIISFFAKKINDIYDKSLLTLYKELIDKHRIPIRYGRNILQESIYKLDKFLSIDKYRTFAIRFYIYIFFVILPRILVTVFLFIDVIIFNEFYYLYKVIWVLIIPLIWKICYYLIKNHWIDQWEYYKIYLDIEIITDPIVLKEKYNRVDSVTVVTRSYLNDKFKSLYSITEEDYIFMINLIPIFVNVKADYVDFYDSDGPIFNKIIYVNCILFIYTTSAIVWGYMSFGIGISYLIRFFI